MPRSLNYDGWLSLPAAARRALGVDTGDELNVEAIDGRIVLRPLKPASAAGSSAPVITNLPPLSLTAQAA